MSALHSWGFIRLEEGASELGDRGADPFPSHCISLHVCVLSHFSWVQLFATPWTVAHQALLSMWILQARILESVAIPCSRGSSQPKDRIHISCTTSANWEAHTMLTSFYLGQGTSPLGLSFPICKMGGTIVFTPRVWRRLKGPVHAPL